MEKEAVELHQTVTAWFCLCFLRSACVCRYATVMVRLGANLPPPCKSFCCCGRILQLVLLFRELPSGCDGPWDLLQRGGGFTLFLLCVRRAVNTCHQAELGVEGGVTFHRVANKNFRLIQIFVMAKTASGNFFGHTCVSVLRLCTQSIASGTSGGQQHLQAQQFRNFWR